MRSFFALLAVVCLAEAKPRNFLQFAPSRSIDPYILNGVNAGVGEFPWQLSQERSNALGNWGHSCGASLLTSNRALSAAHCVDGASASILRVIAGAWDRSASEATQVSNVASYKMHESYGSGAGTFPQDIAILYLATDIQLGGNIGVASLPSNNDYLFTGDTCVISGWGRTSASNTLPNILQKAPIPVISNSECDQRMSGISGASTNPGHICLYDTAAATGSCNGDSGGPLNCQLDGNTVVAGVTSWGIQSGGACAPSYPSVYTRTGWFIDWINTNLP
jgi:secreted trypsin-like serine protease